MRRPWPLAALILTMLLPRMPAAATPAAGLPSAVSDSVYARLDGVREARRQDLQTYLDRIAVLAKAVPEDPAMRRYFTIKNRYHALRQQQPPPPEAVAAIEELKANIRQHYYERYHQFYDILFVDRSGFVFSTIRMQADYHQDLFGGASERTGLVTRLLEQPREAFVDYEYYAVSDEPSAFFVEPMIEDGQHLGWFVMQCAINKINRIFARAGSIGATGEVFLVNRQHQMLTDSRLRPEPSILRRHLSRQNIESKFAERRGHKVVTDYRGFRALTSFEVCPVMGTEWLLIAKMDEDEAVTQWYRGARNALGPRLAALAAQAAPRPDAEPAISRQAVVVDLDEFRKGLPERELVTFGVNTCTAVLITLPGSFSYLGHASVYDRMYPGGEMDLLSNLWSRVGTFEIQPWQQRSMEILLVAPHAESVRGAVDILLAQGFLLSQIRFAHDPTAVSATVVHDPAVGATWVGWRAQPEGDDPGTETWQRVDALPSLGRLLAGD